MGGAGLLCLTALLVCGARAQLARAEASLALEEDKVLGVEDQENMLLPTSSSGLQFVRDLKDLTREVGEGLKVKCEVQGIPPATKFKWFKSLTVKADALIKVNLFSRGEARNE